MTGKNTLEEFLHSSYFQQCSLVQPLPLYFSCRIFFVYSGGGHGNFFYLFFISHLNLILRKEKDLRFLQLTESYIDFKDLHIFIENTKFVLLPL